MFFFSNHGHYYILIIVEQCFPTLPLSRSCQSHLRSLGLEVKFSQAEDPQVFVGKVPLCFMEKENNEVKRGRPSVIKPVVEVRPLKPSYEDHVLCLFN